MRHNFWIIALTALAITACSQENAQELQTWMKDTKAAAKPRVDALPNPKEHVPREYNSKAAVEPFTYLKIASLNSAATQSPDGNRAKEPLEQIPLEAIKMTGILQKKGQMSAMLYIDGKVQQVQVGQHMGQNYGRIIKITESGLTLRELVRDATGAWVSKMTEIPLQDAKPQEPKK